MFQDFPPARLRVGRNFRENELHYLCFERVGKQENILFA